MNAMILLAQGAMNMADSLATANPVLTEVGTPEMNMLDMAIKGGWIMVVLGVLSVVCFYILFERNYMKMCIRDRYETIWISGVASTLRRYSRLRDECESSTTIAGTSRTTSLS